MKKEMVYANKIYLDNINFIVIFLDEDEKMLYNKDTLF